MIAHIAFALALRHPPYGWFGSDKLKHFFMAAFTQSVSYSVLQAGRVEHDRALATAWAVTAAVSIAKEVHDRRSYGLFSVRDLVWDAAGAGAATLILRRAVRTAADEPASARSAAQPDLSNTLVTPLLTVAVPSPILAGGQPPILAPRP